MSKCMTIADEAIDQKETCTGISPKHIVDLILEEALLSAFISSDKGCSRIGDFDITDDFRQQQDQLPYSKDFDQVVHTKKESAANQEFNLNSGESLDLSARENLELIIGSFVKKEERFRPTGECTVISEELLANNELQIQNGQIHLEKNRTGENVAKIDRSNRLSEDKIEIEYFNEGKLNKIYVPLNPPCGPDFGNGSALDQNGQKYAIEGGEESDKTQEPSEEARTKQDPERPFKPFTTEELRQVWGNSKSSLVGKWDGDALAQREEAVRCMEELSSVHVFPDSSADPNRPRACAFAEEDVKKMIREIEEISFSQCHTNPEDTDVVYHPDGQGDADLESKSFTRSKDNFEKSQKLQKPTTDLSPDTKPPVNEVVSSQIKSVLSNEPALAPGSKEWQTTEDTNYSKNNENASVPDWNPLKDNFNGEHHLQYEVADEECQLNSSHYNESLTKVKCSLEGKVDLPVKIHATKENLSSPTGLISKCETNEKSKDVFLTDSVNLKEFHSDVCDEFFPDIMSLSGNLSLSGSQIDEFTLKDFEITSELDSLADVRTLQGKRSDLLKGSRSVKYTQENGPEAIQQGTITLGRLNSPSTETYKCVDSFSEEKDLVSMESNLFLEKQEEMKKSQDPGNFLQGYNFTVEMTKNEKHLDSPGEEINKKLEVAVTSVGNSIVAEFENFRGDDCAAGNDLMKIEEESIAIKDTSIWLTQNQTKCQDSKTSFVLGNEPNNSEDRELPTPSKTENSSESLTENGLAADHTEGLNAGTEKFKLHSQKMYQGGHYEVNGQPKNECSLTESEEAFIDMTESVIQIIDPSENNPDEGTSKISFSLLSEVSKGTFVPTNVEPETSQGKNDSSDVENCTMRICSGMTTIGPIKNVEYDPKDLTAPEIDYGKMTHITSSRQLAKDLGLFSTEVTAIKILQEDDSDENGSLNTEEDHPERTSLVNRDIASLTKVQKIREVMSHQPKPEEDFEGEDVLARPRLDLKDVESMTDERYKVPDVSIPLLSFEIGESDLNSEKELIDSMSLVISGLTSPTYYEDDLEDDNATIQGVQSDVDGDHFKQIESSDNKSVSAKSSKTAAVMDVEGELSVVILEKESKTDENELEDLSKVSEEVVNQQKFGTLGSVFRKASNKFLRKDGDLVRDSKSLPRDANRVSTTDSIRSMTDESQSAASNVLKKSRSLLKNTQGVFKSNSQSRVSSDSAPVRDPKVFPSESDVSAIERKFSSFLKREDFAKAKNIIKSKVEKAFKSVDTTAHEPESSSENTDLRVAIRNEENLQVDRMENFKKLLPKTPLVYKSQFVKSQMDVQTNPTESSGSVSNFEDGGQKNTEETLQTSALEDSNDNIDNDDDNDETAPPDPEKQILEEQVQWINTGENDKSLVNEEFEQQEQHPDYIIMEMVQGLPATDLESPSSGKENLKVDTTKKTEKEVNDLRKMEASNSSQLFSDGCPDVAPCFPEIEDEKTMTKPPSERKFKTKKKFTARFRSFWCAAFGRVKTSPKKGNVS